jgi:hypothetical protein
MGSSTNNKISVSDGMNPSIFSKNALEPTIIFL